MGLSLGIDAKRGRASDGVSDRHGLTFMNKLPPYTTSNHLTVVCSMNRRTFVTTTALAAGAYPLTAAMKKSIPHIATNVYPWFTFYQRRNRDWNADVSAGLKEVAQTGVDGFEAMGNSPEQVRSLGPLLELNQLEMRSIYVNSVLHDAGRAAQSIDEALAIAEAAKPLGVQVVVTNPSPIRWGGPENKNDDELMEQASNLDQLGKSLKRMGLTLAYHNHDAELREGGREFHHMLTATDPEVVKFCLDSHWVFRGCGDSEVALFDAVQHYRERIVELHLRQSKAGVWTEVFEMEGDIAYHRLFHMLDEWKIKPLLVLEQAVEAGSPDTLDAVTAHRHGRRNLEQALV